MKKRTSYVLVLVLALLMLATGCGKKDTPQVDAQAILKGVLENVKYDTKLSEAGTDAQLYFPGLPEGSQVKMYSGSGYFADEVAFITLPDASDTADVQPIIDKHIEEIHNQFMNYVPEELDKIDHAIIHTVDRYIFICITNDYVNAENVLKNGASKQTADSDETTDTQGGTSQTTAETEEPTTAPTENTVPVQMEYPEFNSKSGTFHDYGTNAIRVDDTAFELYGYSDSSAESYAKLVNRAADKLAGKVNVYELAIPTAVGVVLPNDIQKILPSYCDQSKAIEKLYSKLSPNVTPVHCIENMWAHRDEYLYFHTDYHWNGRGAYYAYESFCKTKGIEPIPLEQRELKKFPGFIGALYSKSSGEDPILKANPDTVEAYCPKSTSAEMKFTDSKGQTISWPIIMDVSDWAPGTRYNAFAAGDNPISVFTNPEVTDNSVCIVVKESYGNALMPYLVDHYHTIYEIDYRYWSGDLTAFALEKNATDLVFANNLTMITENLLIGMLAKIIPN